MTQPLNLIVKYLQKGLTRVEEIDLKQWLNSRKENYSIFEDYKKVWELSKNYTQYALVSEKKALQVVHERIGRNKRITLRIFNFRRIASIATIFLVAVGFSYLVYRQIHVKLITVRSENDFAKEIILPDSTHVYLNRHSVLVYPIKFQSNSRDVILKGEAFFEVRKNNKQKFLVHAGQTTTEVLGTRFNVKLDTIAGLVYVNVLSGKVSFYFNENSLNKVILKQNEQAMFNPNDRQIHCSIATDLNYLSWKTGILEFNAVPLNEVCRDLSSFYNQKIYVSTTIASLTLNGTFRNESIENVLEAIKITLDVKVKRNTEGILIYK